MLMKRACRLYPASFTQVHRRPEVLAAFGEPRRMAASTVRHTILRDARESALLRMTVGFVAALGT